MELTQKRISGDGLRRLMSTRNGTLLVAGGTALLAGLVLLVFLNQYRQDVRGGTATTTALVAGALIPKGTSGDLVISQELFRSSAITDAELEEGALIDTQALDGKVAARDIFPGQQITAADFTAGGDPLRGRLAADQRAMSIPIDGAHGLVGNVRTGDSVDVLAGFDATGSTKGAGQPVVQTLLQDVLVLDAPDGDARVGGNRVTSVTLRVDDSDAAKLAFAADNGDVWLVLRPPAGATSKRQSAVSLDSVVSGGR